MGQWWKMVEGEWEDPQEGWSLGGLQGLRAAPTDCLNWECEADAAALSCAVGCPWNIWGSSLKAAGRCGMDSIVWLLSRSPEWRISRCNLTPVSYRLCGQWSKCPTLGSGFAINSVMISGESLDLSHASVSKHFTTLWSHQPSWTPTTVTDSVRLPPPQTKSLPPQPA